MLVRRPTRSRGWRLSFLLDWRACYWLPLIELLGACACFIWWYCYAAAGRCWGVLVRLVGFSSSRIHSRWLVITLHPASLKGRLHDIFYHEHRLSPSPPRSYDERQHEHRIDVLDSGTRGCGAGCLLLLHSVPNRRAGWTVRHITGFTSYVHTTTSIDQLPITHNQRNLYPSPSQCRPSVTTRPEPSSSSPAPTAPSSSCTYSVVKTP